MIRLATAVLLVTALCAAADASPRVFDSIEFTGLKFLRKEVIASGSGITVQNRKIIADPVRINEYLRKESLVASYKLIDKKNSLTIVVSEREPKFNIAVDRAGKTILCELDAKYSVISYTFHRKDLPLVMLHQTDLEGTKLSARVRGVLDLLERSRRLPLWSEIESCSLMPDGFIGIKLRGRGTLFVTDATDESMAKLQAAAGWCDAAGRYPGRMLIRGSDAVVQNR